MHATTDDVIRMYERVTQEHLTCADSGHCKHPPAYHGKRIARIRARITVLKLRAQVADLKEQLK